MRFAALAIIFFAFLVSIQYSSGDVPAVWKQCASIAAKTQNTNPIKTCCVAGAVQKWEDLINCDIIKFSTLKTSPAPPKPSDAITFTATAESKQGLKSIRIQVDESPNAVDGFVDDRAGNAAFLNNVCNDATTCTVSVTVPADTYTNNKVIEYRAKAVDNIGGGYSGKLQLKITNTIATGNIQPKIEFSVSPVKSWFADDFTVTIKYSDADTSPGQQLNTCSYEVMDGVTSKGVVPVTCSGNSQSTSVAMTVGVGKLCLAQGADKCSVKATADDKKGPITAESQPFSIDYTGPAITNVKSSATCLGTQNKMEISKTSTIRADAADLYNEVSSCKYDVTGPAFTDSRTMTLESGSTYAALFTPSGGLGNYQITVTCADTLSNSKTGSALTVNVVAQHACEGTTTTTLPGATTTTLPGATTTTTVPVLTPDFTVAHDPASFTVASGDDFFSMAIITPSNGFSSDIQISGAWQGAAPAGSEFLYPFGTLHGPSYETGFLIIAIGSAASPGTYTFRTTATGGGLTRTADIAVTVTATPTPPGSFAMEHNPVMLTVNKNPETSVKGSSQVKITPPDFAGNIALSGSWLYPEVVLVAGVTPSINPVTSSAPHGAVATFTVAPEAETGFYIWKTTGISDAAQNDAYAILVITDTPPPFLIGFDTVNVGDIRYSLVNDKIVEIKGGAPFFTKGMVSDFFVTGSLVGITEVPCNPVNACSAGASINGGPPVSLSWDVFENAWKGEFDTLARQCDAIADIIVTMGTDKITGEKTFPAFVSCDPRVVVSPAQARVALGTKNEKIFDVTVYDPMVIGTVGDKRYLVEMNPDDLDAKAPFLRHWVRIDCPDGCQSVDETNDLLRASMLAGSVSEDVLSSDGLLRAGMLPTNAARGKYETRVYLNKNGAQMAGTYRYVFSAQASPEIQGSGTLSVYSAGLSEMSTLQLLGALALAMLMRRWIR